MTATQLKATVDQAAFLKVMTRVSKVLQKRNTIPILSNVLIEVEQDSIHVRGNDLDLDLADQVPAEVAVKGAITVPGSMLHGIVSKFPHGASIHLELDGDILVVKSGKSRFRLQTMPPIDYPNMRIAETNHSFTVTGKQMKRLIDRTQFAISTEETRYYLNGIYLHVAKPDPNRATLRAVATDGHRLAQCDMELPEGAAGMPGVIIPRKAVAEILRLFTAEPAAEIKVDVSSNMLRLSSGPTVMITKLIDGTFPDYDRVIPRGNDKVLTVSNKDLLSAADRVVTISSERGRCVKFEVQPGKVTLSVTNADAGSAVEELEAELDGEPVTTGFNSHYVHDLLVHLEGEKATLRLADPGSPALVQGEDESTLYVLMPMRV